MCTVYKAETMQVVLSARLVQSQEDEEAHLQQVLQTSRH